MKHYSQVRDFYAYKGTMPLGQESLGTFNKCIWHDLKTAKGAHNRAIALWGHGNYRLYSFTNFYDDSTFKEQNHGSYSG